MRRGLKLIPDSYEEYVYLIGDKLQIYNDAGDGRTDRKKFYNRWLDNPEKQFVERSTWISKLHDTARGNAVVVGVDDIVDAGYMNLLRQLSILYVSDLDFRKEVNLIVLDATGRRHNHRSRSSARRLSLLYVIEELALNLATRKKFDVYDEYYLGPQLRLLLELFKGKYRWFLDEIGYTVDYRTDNVRFFSWTSGDMSSQWQEQRI